MADPSEYMMAIVRAEIGRLVMDNAALKARVQVLEAENKELRAAPAPRMPQPE